MTPNEVFYLIDQRLDEEYELPDELDNLKNQVRILSEQVATLTSDRNEMLKLIALVAEGQDIEVRVEA